MKRLMALTILLMALLALGTSSAVYADDAPPPEDPEATYSKFYDAINAGDLEEALKYLDENVVRIALPPPPGTNGYFIGAEAYSGMLAYLISSHAEFEFVEVHVSGNMVTARGLLTEDLFRRAGFYPVRFSISAVIKDGKLVSETGLIDDMDARLLGAAVGRMLNKNAVMRGYDEAINQGNMEVLDQDISPDAINHSAPDLKGVDAFKSPLMELRAAFPDLQATADMIVAEGDLVTAVATYTGTQEGEYLGVSPSGAQVTWTQSDVYRFENGQVVEAWHIGAPAVILEALTSASE